MNITDDMIVTFDAAYMVCAETHVGGDGDTSERCCIASGIERVAPLIAAQALRDAAVHLSRTADGWDDDGPATSAMRAASVHLRQRAAGLAP